jgi:hypothetical protein
MRGRGNEEAEQDVMRLEREDRKWREKRGRK